MSIMRVFFNWRIETSNKFDRKVGIISDGDLTNHSSMHNYEHTQLKHMTLTNNTYDNAMTFYYTQLYI